MPFKYPSLEVRLLANIVETNGCWVWQGNKLSRANHRYGRITFRNHLGKVVKPLVHRVAFVLWNGPLDPRKVICHLCKNSLCINPDHIIQGTQRQNLEHMRGHIPVDWRAYFKDGVIVSKRARPESAG